MDASTGKTQEWDDAVCVVPCDFVQYAISAFAVLF